MATTDRIEGMARIARAAEAARAISRKTWLAVGGSMLAALGALSCCVAPFALFALGISGAWIGNLTALAPYQPIFLVLALAFLAAGFVRIYRKPKAAACAEGSWCARPASDRLPKAGLWTAANLVAVAAVFPHVAPLLIDL